MAFDETVGEMERRLTRGIRNPDSRPAPRGGRVVVPDMSPPADRGVAGTQQRDRLVRRMRRKGEQS